MRNWLARHTSFASRLLAISSTRIEQSPFPPLHQRWRGGQGVRPHNSTGHSQDTLYTGLPHRSIDFALAKGVQKIWYQWPSGCLLFSYACCCILLLSACESHAVSTFPVLQTVSDVLALPSKILVWKLPLDD